MAAPPPSFGGPPPAAPPAAVRPPSAAPTSPTSTAPLAPTPLASDGRKADCPKCGNPNHPSFKYCGTCGHPLQDAVAASSPPAAVSVGGAGSGTLVLIRPDGTEGESIAFQHQSVIGRETTPQFASDTYLSPRHACFLFEGGGVTVRDENSLNGVYLRIDRDAPVELKDRSIFRVGQEIIRFENFPPMAPGPDGVEAMGSPREGLIGRICLISGRGTTGNCYSLPAEGLHLGRERGDLLFPEDGYVSGLHARLHYEGGRIFLTDVGSSNGTFIRVAGTSPVTSGGMLLLGQQLFRVEY